MASQYKMAPIKDDVDDDESEVDESDTRLDDDTPPSDRKEGRSDSLAQEDREIKISLYTLYLTSLMGAIGYSSIMTSAYPYLLSLDPDAKTSLYGWVIAMYSIGQLLSSPALGALSLVIPYRVLFIVTIILMVIGNITYAYISLFPSNLSGWIMLLARFVLGVAAGNMTMIRAYASTVTSEADRPVAMAWATGTQALGFVIGPIIQTACTPIGNGFTLPRIRMQFNMYTFPAFLAACINIVNLCVFVINFKEVKPRKDERRRSSLLDVFKAPSFISIGLCCALWFTFLFAFSFFETIMTPLVQAEYGWSYQKTILANGIVLFCNAILSSLVYVGTRPITKRFKERHLLFCATLGLCIGFALLIPMSSKYPPLAPTDANSTTSLPGTTAPPDLTTPATQGSTTQLGNTTAAALQRSGRGSVLFSNKVTPETDPTEIIGCSTEIYPWCEKQHKILFVQFILCSTTLSVAYPIGMVTITSLYSQSLGSQPQGIYQGILTSSGSLSRALGPVFVSNVFQQRGPMAAFPSIVAITGIVALLVLIFNRRFGNPDLPTPTSDPPQQQVTVEQPNSPAVA